MRKLLFILVIVALTSGLFAAACSHMGEASQDDTKLVKEVRRAKPGVTVATAANAPTNLKVTAANDKPSADRGLTFAVVSDLNSHYGSTDYRKEVHAAVKWLVDDVHPDLVISTGDMVAGQRAGLDYEAMWQGFHRAVTRPLIRAGIPFAITPGNHDASAGAAYQKERVIFVDQWRRYRPKVHFVDDAFYPLHYAFVMGPALFVSLDATLTGPIDEHQRAWLRRVLDAHKDKKVKIVFGHVPLYPFAGKVKNEILADTKLEALLDEYDVDLMITGHHHAYYPGRRGHLRLLGMACLGSGARKLVGSDETSANSAVVVHVSADGEVSYDAYRAIDHTKIERKTLPEHLNDGAYRIWRDDVAPPAP